ILSELIAGAETGWDFSSRWFENHKDLSTVITTTIIPVDLNAILYAVETTLSKFHRIVGNTNKEILYANAAEARKAAIHNFLWDATSNQWLDYDFTRP